jgi:hypothetical protein
LSVVIASTAASCPLCIGIDDARIHHFWLFAPHF